MTRPNLKMNASGTVNSEVSTYKKTVLPNGIRVVTETIPYVRSVSMGIWLNVGSRDETPETNGIGHFLEHMVFKGTRNRNVREIAQSLESLGGYLNAFTTKEHTCFYARVLDNHIPTAIDVLSDLVLHGTFLPKELEREKLVVIEELKNAEDNPEDIIHDYFEKAIFPSHSLGYPIIGTTANLQRFSGDDLRTHVTSHYHPERMVVAAAGNLQHDALVEHVARLFKGARPSKNGRKRDAGPRRGSLHKVLEYQKPITQAHVLLGAIAPGLNHKDRYPMLVLNALLGEGMSSRLYQNIREKYGFAYSVFSYVNMMSDTGVFGAYIGTDKKNIQRSQELIIKEVVALKTKPVSKKELDRTKSQIKGTMMLGLENMSGRMTRLGTSELYFESFTSLDAIISRIDAVTPEAVQRVATGLFKEEELSTIVIRPS